MLPKDIVHSRWKNSSQKRRRSSENLITGEDGSVTVKNLPLGSYNVTASTRPRKFFYNAKETKSNNFCRRRAAEAAFSETTFTNDRQKAVGAGDNKKRQRY